MPNPPATQDPHPLQWIHIDDFSPGCYDGSHISLEHPTISAPLGAANRTGTYCCAVIPGGALGPLPALTTTYPFSTIGGFPGATTTAIIAGFIVTPYLNFATNQIGEVVTVVEASDGTTHYYATTSFVPPATLHTITGPTYNSALAGMGFFGAPYPSWTRMSVTGGPPAPPPKLVFPTSDDSGHTSGHLWVYPSIAAPTTYVADDIIGSSVTGQVITYANRVIVMQGTAFPWPGGDVATNESLSFTDPSNSNSFGDQSEFFTSEDPWGYGAWGTQSVGELLLVKKIGGADIMNGDIIDPSVIYVPGVQSTGNLVGRAKATPIGLIYCSQNQGAWIWNGGNSSQKISKNIADDFFDLEQTVILSNNYGFYVDQWQKWILFSGNAIYDTDTSSWWNLFPPKGINLTNLPIGRNIWWYAPVAEANQIAAAPLQVTSTSDPWCSVFDNTVPSPVYTWQSLPIHVTKNADRVVDVRSVVIRASDPTLSGATGTATVSIEISSFSGTSTDTITATPTPIRYNIGTGADGLYDIQLNLACTNVGAAAPIIHSIDIGYRVRAPKAVTN